VKHFYKATGYAAGFSIVVIAVAILIQVGGRLMGLNFFGLVEVSTYAMVAATFIALPYTLRTGGHIRVSLLLSSLTGGPRKVSEIACYALTLAFVAYFFYYALDLTLLSYSRGARSQGMLSTPLWIPQGIMTAGILFFGIALVDGLVRLVQGRMELKESQPESL
jgi:TRAP-type C4-dicarboxylate transport system permease small subunit